MAGLPDSPVIGGFISFSRIVFLFVKPGSWPRPSLWCPDINHFQALLR